MIKNFTRLGLMFVWVYLCAAAFQGGWPRGSARYWLLILGAWLVLEVVWLVAETVYLARKRDSADVTS